MLVGGEDAKRRGQLGKARGLPGPGDEARAPLWLQGGMKGFRDHPHRQKETEDEWRGGHDPAEAPTGAG